MAIQREANGSMLIGIDRWYGRNLQVKNGLPVQETHKIVGVTDLKEFLTNHKNYFVKIDTFRGVTESFRHYDWKDTEGEIEYLIHKVDPYKEDVVFTVEELIDGIEPGFDGITFDGETLYPTMCGYEMKGAGYISRTYKNEGERQLLLNRSMMDYHLSLKRIRPASSYRLKLN